MKKLSLLSIATIVALGLGSCAENEPGPQENEKVNLTIKLSGAEPLSRTIQDPATGKPSVNSGQIYVADLAGNIIQVATIVPAEAVDGAGQKLPTPVPVGASVYIVANPATSAASATTLTGVTETVSTIASQNGAGIAHTGVALANTSGTGAVVSGTGEVTLTVGISPLVARLELAGLQAVEDAASGNIITAYDVTGVYVDDYYPGFTYTGAADGQVADLIGAISANGEATAFAAWEMKDAPGPWTANTTSLVAVPGTDKVWAYNLVSSGLPRLILSLDNIKYKRGDAGAETALTGVRYLIVDGYTGTSGNVSSFARGNVYRIGKLDTNGDSNFQFNFSHLAIHPDQQSVGLTVKVEVADWIINDYTPTLRP